MAPYQRAVNYAMSFIGRYLRYQIYVRLLFIDRQGICH